MAQKAYSFDLFELVSCCHWDSKPAVIRFLFTVSSLGIKIQIVKSYFVGTPA